MKFNIDQFRVDKTVNAGANPMPHGYYPWREKPRYSDCLAYVMSGSAVYSFGNYTFSVEKGDLIFMAYGGQYSIKSSPDYAVAYADFMLERKKHEHGMDSCVLPVADHSGLEKYAIELVKLHKKWLPQNLSMHMQLMSIIYGMISCAALYGSDFYVSVGNREKITEAEKIILREYCRSDFNISEIVDGLGMSEVHFRRLFISVYGVTPNQYLTTVRMRAAKALLVSDEYTIGEIAEKVGYNSVYYFSRAFKRECGVTPSDFRNMDY